MAKELTPTDIATMSPADVHKGSGLAVGGAKWYIAECKPTRERTVRTLLQDAGYDAYVAGTEELRVYKSRNRRVVEKIVIPGRVFVHTEENQLMPILLAYSSVHRFMLNRAAQPDSRGNRPFASITDREMQQLQYILNNAPNPVLFTLEDLTVGQEIEILRGPFAGMKGHFSKKSNAVYIVLKMEMGTTNCIYTEVSLEDVGPVR